MRALILLSLNVIAGLTLSACVMTASIDRVANTELVSHAFSQALQARYVELAYEELEQLGIKKQYDPSILER